MSLLYGAQYPHHDCTTSANETPCFLLFPYILFKQMSFSYGRHNLMYILVKVDDDNEMQLATDEHLHGIRGCLKTSYDELLK